MIALLVLFLIGALIWVCGTLPWLIINFFLCVRSEPSVACAYPDTYVQHAGQILAADMVIIICSIFAVMRLRKLRRAHQ